MKYFIDEHGSTLIAIAARSAGLDALSSHEIGRDGLTDRDQMTWAGQRGRCVVTQNHPDFRSITEDFRQSGAAHAGILFVRSGRITRHDTGAIVAALVAHAVRNPDGMPPYMIDFLRF